MKHIKAQSVYHDKTSQEKHYPYTVKPKNKIAGNKIHDELGVYVFLVLSSDNKDQSKSVEFAVKYDDSHLVYKKDGYMLERRAYCDPDNYELMTRDEILSKRQNPNNRFLKVARLCDEKWQEISEKVKSAEFRRKRITRWQDSPQNLSILVGAFVAPEEDIESILRSFGLSYPE